MRREIAYALAIIALLALVIVPNPVEATVYKWFAAVRIGSGAPSTSALNLASGTAASGGIAFGTDVSVYRGATAKLYNNASMYVMGDTQLGHDNTHTTTAYGLLTAAASAYVMDDTTLGSASTDTVTCTARLILRTLGSDPLDATPGNRPAGSAGEIAVYSGGVYLCTNASTPTWVLVGPPAG